ncbi:hypothetical protein, partial [Ruminococcus sp.]
MAETKKKSTASKGRKPEAPKREPISSAKAAPQNESNQLWSILLFAIGVLTALMVLVKGTKGWLKL